MAKGNKIIVSAQPKGVFEGCVVSGTPKPGTCMEIVAATALKGGRWTYEAAGTTAAAGAKGMAADGDNIAIAVLLSDLDAAGFGRLATTAFVDGDRANVYYPLPGEELNMLFFNISGTGDDVVLGTKLIVDDGTGQVFTSTGTVESEPFIALEALTDPTADQLIWCKATGQ
jgi:hypothetical protein